jgi:hypothetical protein
VAHLAVVSAQDRRVIGFIHFRSRLLGPVGRRRAGVLTIAIGAILALVTGTLGALAIGTLPLGTLPLGTLAIGTLAVGTLAIEVLPLVAAASGAIVAKTVFPETVVALSLVRAVLAIAAAAVVAVPIEAVLTSPFLARALIAIAAIVGRPLVAALGLALNSFSVGLGGLRLTAFILEIYVIAGDELVAADDVGQRALRLHGPHHPEIVLGVLQVVFGRDPIAGRVGVAGQLLIFLIDVLSGPADLDPVGPVGIERAVGVVLRLAATTAPATTAAVTVAVTLALYTFEISHVFLTCCANRRGQVVLGPSLCARLW